MAVGEEFEKLVDSVRDLYKTKVGFFIMLVINTIVCAYTAFFLGISQEYILSIIPMVTFLMNSMYLYSLVKPVKRDSPIINAKIVDHKVVDEATQDGKQ